MELSVEQAAELRKLVNVRDIPADMATRGRIVLWSSEGCRRKYIAALLGVSLPTVDRWKATDPAGPGSRRRHGCEPA